MSRNKGARLPMASEGVRESLSTRIATRIIYLSRHKQRVPTENVFTGATDRGVQE